MTKRRFLPVLAVLAVLLLISAAYTAYDRLLSPTRIGFVNYPDYLYAGFAAAAPNRFVRVDRIDWKKGDAPDLSRYRALYVFGMGLRLSPDQDGQLRQAVRSGTTVYVSAATSAENDLTSLTGDRLTQIRSYLDNGGAENYRRLLNYTRRVIDGKTAFTEPVKPPVKIPFDCLYHTADDAIFTTVDAYLDYYRRRPGYNPANPRVCFISTNAGPSSARRDHLNAIITALEKQNLNVFPVCGFRKRFEYLEQIKPDLVILMPHGRFAAGDGDRAVAWLRERNIPLLCPINVFAPYDSWLKDQRGMTGGIMSQSIVMPELDGGIVPYALTAQFPNARGLYEFKAIPERLEQFTALAGRFAGLRRKANADKKIAVFFYKGPGRNALNAAGLEVGESLFNFLQRLRRAGYNLDGLPDSADKLLDLIQRRAGVFGPYAKGASAKFLAEGDPALIPVTDYLNWVGKAMPADLYAEVEKRYGPAPGPYLSREQDGRSYLAVGRLRFGNVVILPQPMAGYGEDTAKIVHGAKAAPPHPYLAAYLWVKYGFGADAMIHFGTHGSLEFTPWKQVALSQYDWPDVLTAGMPHFYYYIINNIGEAVIAKRRAAAALVSHLTAPFMSAGLYDDLRLLHDKLHHGATVEDPMLRAEYDKSIAALILKLKLADDLDLPPPVPGQPLSAETREKVHNYLHSLEEAKVSRGVYVLGRPYTAEEAAETARLMTVDAIAQSFARLDELKGRLTPAERENRHLYELRYRQPAERAVTAILAGQAAPESFLPPADRLPAGEGQSAERADNVNLMAMMMAMQADAAEKKSAATAARRFTEEELTRLIVKLAADPERKTFLDSLRNAKTRERALALTDPVSLRKARRIARLIPEMNRMITVAADPDMQLLLGQMRQPAQSDLVLRLLGESGLKEKIAAAAARREAEMLRRCLVPEAVAALDLALDPNRLRQLAAPAPAGAAAALRNRIAELKGLRTRWEFMLRHRNAAAAHPENPAAKRLAGADTALREALRLTTPALARLEQQYADYRQAVATATEALTNVDAYRRALLSSTEAEMTGMLNALNGGYISPSSGGDPLINPNAVPTGRNLYAINAEATPTREAWEVGKKLGEALIAVTLKKEKRYPRKVAFSLWGGEFIRSQGVNIAEILFLLGVEPVWNSRGVVTDVRLIPAARLKRPRIDVAVQTSGQFRDAAASRIYLIDKAVRLAAVAEDGPDGQSNQVREGVAAAEKYLIEQGIAPLQARELATARVFGGVNGNYGSGIMGLVESGDRWEKSDEIADRYLQNMGAVYRQDAWSEFTPGLMAAALQNTDTVVHPRSSNTSGPLSLDHVYEFMGGMNLAVRKVTGKEPAAYFNDLRRPGSAMIQTAKEAAMTEARSTVLNPAYIKEMMQEGPSAAGHFAEVFRNSYGWEVMKPELLDDHLWEEYKQVYVDDRHQLGLRAYFEKKNPYALQEMTAVMLETIRKGFWKADQETQRRLARLHAELVKDHQPGCSGFVCDNAKLRNMISSLLDSDAARKQYNTAIDQVRNAPAPGERKVTGMVLEKEETTLLKSAQNVIRENRFALIAAAVVAALLLAAVIRSRRRPPEA